MAKTTQLPDLKVQLPKDEMNLTRRKKLQHSMHDAFGSEVPDPTPIAPPVGYKQTKPIHEQIRDQVRLALAIHATSQGFETPEEADDFNVDDDYDPRSPFEEQFEPSPRGLDTMAELVERGMTAAFAKHTAGGGRVEDLLPTRDDQPVDRSRSLPKGNEASRIDRGDPPPEATTPPRAPKQRS